MTCIVGLKSNGSVMLGGDSLAVGGLSVTKRKDSKVFRLNKDFIVGFTSSFRMGQIIEYELKALSFQEILKEYPNSPDPVFRYLVVDFVAKLISRFAESGFLQKNNEVASGGTFLVGIRDRLFCIQSDFQVEESLHDYNAVGCGSDLALGSLFTTEQVGVLSTDFRLNLALQAASEFSGGVGAPFNYVTTQKGI